MPEEQNDPRILHQDHLISHPVSGIQPKVSPDVRRRPSLPGRTGSASPLCGLHGDVVKDRIDLRKLPTWCSSARDRRNLLPPLRELSAIAVTVGVVVVANAVENRLVL